MATLIFLNGYLSKNIQCQRKKDVTYLLIPYVVSQILIFLFLRFFNEDDAFELGVPIFANWYILAIFLWRLVAPYFDHIKYPILTSILISLSIGLLKDFTFFLDLQRVFTFLPYFIIGRYLSTKRIDFVFGKKTRPYLFGVAILIIISGFVYIAATHRGVALLLRKVYVPYNNYDDWLNLPVHFALVTRAFLLASSIFIGFIFLQMVPRRKTWFSKYGEQLIYVVAFHMLFIFPFEYKLPYKPIITEAIALPVSFLVVVILNIRPIKSALKYVLNPFLFFRKGNSSIS
jgi:hypothetical protein